MRPVDRTARVRGSRTVVRFRGPAPFLFDSDYGQGLFSGP